MQYQLIYKNIKYLNVRIKEGNVIVSAPMGMSVHIIEHFLKENELKIKEMILNYQRNVNKYEIGNNVRIFGEYYNIKWNESFQIKNHSIYVENESQLNKFLRKNLESYILDKFNYYCDLLSEYFNPPKIKFSYLKGKWGVCYTKKKEIGFSYKLIHTSKPFIDYVILHELAHLVHPNHSKHFYYFIEKYMPNYKKIIQDEKNMI